MRLFRTTYCGGWKRLGGVAGPCLPVFDHPVEEVLTLVSAGPSGTIETVMQPSSRAALILLGGRAAVLPGPVDERGAMVASRGLYKRAPK